MLEGHPPHWRLNVFVMISPYNFYFTVIGSRPSAKGSCLLCVVLKLVPDIPRDLKSCNTRIKGLHWLLFMFVSWYLCLIGVDL